MVISRAINAVGKTLGSPDGTVKRLGNRFSISHFAGSAGIPAGNLPGFTNFLTAGKDAGVPRDGKMRIAATDWLEFDDWNKLLDPLLSDRWMSRFSLFQQAGWNQKIL